MSVLTNSAEGWSEGAQLIDMGAVDHALLFEQPTDPLVETTIRSRILTIDPGGAAVTVTLPPAAGMVGGPIVIHNNSDNAEVITVNDDTTARGSLLEEEGCNCFSDGTRWYVVMAGTET